MSGQQRNYGAEMAAYLERSLSAPLHIQNPPQDTNRFLAMLTDLVRQGVRGAFDALARQLRPVLISLATTLEPEDPHDILTALYEAVLRGKKTLIQVESDISTIYRTEWRSKKRKKVGVARLQLVQAAEEDILQGESVPGEISILLKYLNEDDQRLWIGMSQEKTLAQIARELGWSLAKTEKRWQELTEKLKTTLDSESI